MTFGLVLVTVTGLVTLHVVRPGSKYAWLAGMLGSLLVWLSVFLWQMEMGFTLSPGTWQPDTLFDGSPRWAIDPIGWLFALSLTAMSAAIILSAPARLGPVSPMAWVGTISMTTLGLLAVTAANPLTLLLTWAAIDFTEFFSTLHSAQNASASERTVIAFGIRAFGTGLAMWALANGGMTASFDAIQSQEAALLLVAAGLRLGVLPLHLPHRTEPALRRGLGTAIRLTAATSSLVLLARTSAAAASLPLTPLLVLVTLAALYAGWKWLSVADELTARPYWIIGMASLAVVAALRGNATGSAALGSTLVLFGSLSFLYSSRNPQMGRILALLALGLGSLPFTLTATSWQGAEMFIGFWPFLLIAQTLLVVGYIRHILRASEDVFAALPRWTQISYPAGLGILALTSIIGGLWGWPGALSLGNWGAALTVFLLSGIMIFILLRITGVNIPSGPGEALTRLSIVQDAIARLLWGLYILAARIINFIANLLEGDGGLLWTLLLLVVIFSLVQSQ